MPDPTELLKRMEAKKKAGQVPGAQADTSAAAPVPPPTSPADTQVAPEKPVAVPAAPKAPRPKPPPPPPPPVDPESVVAARNAAAEKAIGSTVGPPWDPSEGFSYEQKSEQLKLIGQGYNVVDAAERVKAMSPEQLRNAQGQASATDRHNIMVQGLAQAEGSAGSSVVDAAKYAAWMATLGPWRDPASRKSAVEAVTRAALSPEELRRLADEMEKK